MEVSAISNKTLYLLSTQVGGGVNHLALQDGGSAPANLTTGTGWTVGTTAAGNYAAMAATVERLAATFGTALLPDAVSGPNNTLGDSFRTPLALTGQFKAGSWVLTFPLIAVTAGGAADVRIRVRVWRSTSSTGANATEILTLVSGDQVSQVNIGTPDTNVGTGAAQNSVVTIPMPYFGLTGEFLFTQVSLEITGPGAGATDDVLIRIGSATIVTTDWRPASLATHNVIIDGLGIMFPEGSQGYGFGKSHDFAAKQSVGQVTNADRLRNAVKEWTTWNGGSGVALEDAAKVGQYRTGYGLDTTTVPGSAQVGPGLIASLPSARNAQRVFGLYNSQLYVGSSTGQVARQTATDTWTDPVGTITSSREVTAIAEAGQSVNGVTTRMWVANRTNAQLASWNGTTFTNNDADFNTASDALARITCLSSWTPPAPILSSAATFVVGGKLSATNQVRIGLAEDAAFSGPGEWIRDANILYSNLSDIGYPDVTASLAAADSQFYWCAADISGVKGQLIKSTWLLATGVNRPFQGPQVTIAYLADDYITALVELNGTMYGLGAAGRLYTIETDHVSVVSTAVSPTTTDTLSGMTAWNNALWFTSRVGTTLLIRRYGPSDPSNPDSDKVWSDPIYGGAIDASAIAARQLTSFGGYLYAATEAAGASKVYRADKALNATIAVTIESSVTDCGLSGLDKSFQSVTITHAALLSGESIQILYRLNDTGAWLSIGTSNTVGATTATFLISGRIGQTIAIQAILTAASSAATPALYAVTLTYRPYPSPTREWSSLRVDLRSITGSFMPLKATSADYPAGLDSWTGLELRDAIWAVLQRGACQLTDIDGQVYTVAPDDWKGTLSQVPSIGGYRLEGALSLSELA